MNVLWWCAFLTTVLCLFSPGVPDSVGDTVCGTTDGRVSSQTIVSIDSKKDASDVWVTTITSYSDGSPKGNNLNVTRRLIACGGKEIIQVTAVIGGSSSKHPVFVKYDIHEILFHPTGGKNIVVSRDRRTVYRINTGSPGDYAGVLTNRHLNDNELFEVTLDRTVGPHAGNIAVGITPVSPAVIAYPDWMKSGATMVYDSSVYINGTGVSSGHGFNLYSLAEGQRVGVMKKSNGEMHIFVDGVDKGVATSGINYPVYGVIELYHKAAQATIV